MVKPREPPAVEKPHISEIGMLPQVIIVKDHNHHNYDYYDDHHHHHIHDQDDTYDQAFSPLSPSSCPPPSDFASPLLPRRRLIFIFGLFRKHYFELSVNRRCSNIEGGSYDGSHL